MKQTASRPAIEVAVEWIAALCLGGAVGFAILRLALAGPIAAGAIGLLVAVAALLAVGRVDRQGSMIDGFVPADWPVGAAEEDVLLLDDPLPAIDADSRVVRLFAAEPAGAEEGQLLLAGPGEMVARIEDYLGFGRGSAAAVEPARATNTASVEASAALHAALADIRRSLRQG